MPKPSNQNNWMTRVPSQHHQFERIEAFFSNHSYKPHRHDTYAIGQTLSGVQNFHYRGALQHSLAGMTMVLHPDEQHDGEAGTTAGYHYRMIYIEPALIQSILQGKPLPFIQQGLSQDPRLFQATQNLLLHKHLDTLEEEDALFDLATRLCEVSDSKLQNTKTFDYRAAETAREYILAYPQENLSLKDLEQQTDRDRWSLSRDFRLLFGTSPHRYMTMRRLESVKAYLSQGESLVNAAIRAGFFDQSHMTRHFIKAFGLSPAQWKKMNAIHQFNHTRK